MTPARSSFFRSRAYDRSSSFETPSSRIGAVGRWLAYAAFLGSFFILLLTVIAHAAPWTEIAARADVASPLAGHAMFIGALSAIAVLSPRGAVATLAAAVAIAALGHAGLGFRHLTTVPFKATGNSDNSIRFLALNGWHYHRHPARLEAAIAASGADVVVLSEAGPDRQPMLDRLRALYPHMESCAERWECSLVILSRLPVQESGSGRTALESPPLVWARIATNGGPLTIVGTHLHRPSRDALVHRRHVDAIAKLVASVPGQLVLAGDFNTSPYSASYRFILERTGLAPVARLLPTWPAWPVMLPQVALDHIFLSDGLRATSAGAGPVSGSDHLPIWATIEMVDRAAPLARSLQ